MARPSNTLKRRSLQTGGFLSKFRRAVLTRTQKITNRIPLSYIARFKKAFPNGEIADTGYKYLILGYGDTLEDKLPKYEVIDDINSKIYNILNPYENNAHPSNMLLTKLWHNGTIGLLSKNMDNTTILINARNIPHSANIINKNTYTPNRIFIYKPSDAKSIEVVSDARKLVSSQSSRSRLSSQSSRSRLSSRSRSRLSSRSRTVDTLL